MKFVPPPENPTCNVLLYGGPKTGKTTGAASAPGPVLLVNTDLPNATMFARRQHRNVQELSYEGFQSMVEIANLANKGDLKFRTVVIDTVADQYRLLLDELSKRAVSPTLPTYQAVSVHLERFWRSLCEAPTNVVFVAHDMPVKDDATGEIERLPATGTTNPALGRKLMGMVDVVGYTGVAVEEDSEPRYMAQLINAAGRRGGDRFNVLGTSRELDLTEWFALMTNQRDNGRRPEKETDR
jgi:phage nucleotide-binding protein